MAHIGDRRWSAGPNPGGLTELEVAAGWAVDQELRPERRPAPSNDPLAELEREALGLLQRKPCVVAFSGGRDSSALLAVFLRVARREGLPDPIAVTARFEGDAMSQEADWQEQVARALEVREWEIIRPEDDVDLLGPTATAAISRHGLLWPAPVFALLPLIRQATGGVLVTGQGGDELLGCWAYRHVWATLRQRRRPPVRALVALGAGVAPLAVRGTPFVQREGQPYQDWLRPGARSVLRRALAAEKAIDPVRWDRYVEVTPRRRGLSQLLSSLSRLCEGEAAVSAAPLLSPGFVAALGRRGGRLGLGDRTSAMTQLFGDLLPTAVLGRSTKATFGGVFWGPLSREFALRWNGRGLSADLVDPYLLRAAWQAERPVYGAALPLQAAWLATAGGHPDTGTGTAAVTGAPAATGARASATPTP